MPSDCQTSTLITIRRMLMKNLILLIFIALSSFVTYSQAPTAQFTATNLTACAGVPINFINQSTPGGSPLTGFSWDFGDGNSASTQDASHAYTNAGTYTVTLVASAANGQADAEVKATYITIYPNPLAAFTTSGNGCTVPFGVTFTNGSATGPGITYSWTFGNGQTSTAQNPPMVTYGSAGTFDVSLTVTNTTTGCTSNITHSLVVSNFAAGITAPATACVGVPVPMQDNSTVGANSWIWSSGAGQTIAQQNPTFVYSTPGTYTITLTSQNTTSGCQSTVTKPIIVYPNPIPAFTASQVIGCTPSSIVFTNNSPAGTTFTWDFGDGQTYTGQNPPPHIYTDTGLYDVTLTMTSVNGCTSTKTIQDMIHIFPVEVDFTANVVEGCDPLVVQFHDDSHSPNPGTNPIVSWQWSFGDGQTYSGQTPPPHTYQLGVYDVTLTVTTQSGCTKTHTWQDTIQVGHIESVDFTSAPLSTCAKTDVSFTNQSVIGVPHDPADVDYHWNFIGDGTSPDENPTHQFTTDTGYFDVQLIVDYRGCKDSITKTNVVYIIAPIARFSPDQSLFCNPASLPINVQLIDQAIYGVIPDDVDMTWNFGDGQTAAYDDADVDDSDKGTVSHTYTDYGTYVVKQVIHNYTTGCADSTTRQIHISHIDASFALSNDSVCRTGSISASNTTTSAHPVSMAMWSSPGATYQYNYSTPSVSYTYIPAGTYNITMVATNSVGCQSTEIVPVTALEFPKAEFTADDFQGCAPFDVTFTNQSHPQGNGAPVGNFLWTFVDENTSVTTPNLSTNVEHTFMTEDTFDIRLVATDYFGCVSQPQTIQVITTKPVAGFTVDSVVCDLEIFQTVDTSAGVQPLTYQWFADGLNTPSIGTDPTASHAFDDTPSANYTHLPHTVWLIVTDNNGCKDTVMQDIIVSLPIAGIDYTLQGANINADGSFNCPPVFATFADSSESFGDIASWNWNFGDGKSSILQNPNNTYVFSGTYSTSLTITDEFGCTSDTMLVNYLSIGGPSAEPSWSISPGVSCSQNIVFTMNNMHSVSDIIWTTGDGQTVNDSIHFIHVYPNNTSFEPSVVITDSLGCEVLYPLPTINIPDNGLEAFFVPNTHETMIGGQFIFDDQSTSDAPIVSWHWDFGDGTSVTNTTGDSPTHSYTNLGTWIVTLTVTDINGCKHTYTFEVSVIGNIDVPNVFTPNGNGVNENFTLMHDMFKKYDVVIVNRWGDVVEKKLGHTGVLLWDGRSQNGKECVDGVYFYKITGTLWDGSTMEKDGFVTLIRTE